MLPRPANRSCAEPQIYCLPKAHHLLHQKLGRAQINLPKSRIDVFKMVRRRALEVGIKEEISPHTFRATVITVYLENCGALEHAQQIAAHESSRTTKLYDRRSDEVSLDRRR